MHSFLANKFTFVKEEFFRKANTKFSQQFILCYPDIFLQGFECVAYYECGADGTIITDGAGLIGGAD